MRACYSDGYVIELPEGHRFPMPKFRLLRDLLLREKLLAPSELVEPTPATWTELARVHTPRYLADLEAGRLDARAQRRMGLPWSRELVQRSRLAVGGTLEAARLALREGVAANLAGGTHHAFPGHGEGFCVLNDVAVAIRSARASRLLQRALVVDLDLHQGNGTAAIFAADAHTYTLSIHGARNFPFRKQRSSWDVGLPDAIGDRGYLEAVQEHVPRALQQARPDLVVYLAGVDPVEGDRFGRLGLTRRGLIERERLVLESVHAAGAALCIVMGGGYASTPEQTADLHAVVHRQARRMY